MPCIGGGPIPIPGMGGIIIPGGIPPIGGIMPGIMGPPTGGIGGMPPIAAPGAGIAGRTPVIRIATGSKWAVSGVTGMSPDATFCKERRRVKRWRQCERVQGGGCVGFQRAGGRVQRQGAREQALAQLTFKNHCSKAARWSSPWLC